MLELSMMFDDRRHAGQLLAGRLVRLAGRSDVVVIGLPRGGVPVAGVVADRLSAPLDVLVVRKLGFPMACEVAMGAIASGGLRVMNSCADDVAADVIEAIAGQEEAELLRREALYRGDRPPLSLRDKVVLVVDDGLATGATMRVAVQAVRRLGARAVIACVPVGEAQAIDAVAEDADEVVCLLTPDPFDAVGHWYRDFSQTSDEEVQRFLRERPPPPLSPPLPSPSPSVSRR